MLSVEGQGNEGQEDHGVTDAHLHERKAQNLTAAPGIAEEDLHVTGTLVWYYYVCHRQVWLMGHQIDPDREDDNLAIGRRIHQESYRRYKKELRLGWVRLDVIRQGSAEVVITEIKKSSRYRKSATMQLAYYLWLMEKAGVRARGELRFPKERRKEEIVLTPEIIAELQEAHDSILALVRLPSPPRPVRTRWCRKCAYAELCWA